jgi:hypothetical protein
MIAARLALVFVARAGDGVCERDDAAQGRSQ